MPHFGSRLVCNLRFILFIQQRQFICNQLALPTDIFYENLKSKLAEKFGDLVDGIEQLNLLEDVPIEKMNSPVDTLSQYLQQQLSFGRESVRKFGIKN